MSILAGKIAIVTGASKGIGAGIAKGLGAAGASVIVNYASSKESADRVVADILAAGGKAIAVQGDVSKAADVEKLFTEAGHAFGPANVIVNNAGVYEFGPIEAFTEHSYRAQYDTSVLGTFLMIQRAVAQFGPDGGTIINISSNATRNNNARTSLYTAVKAGIDAITRTLAKELGPRKIRVNAISPGATNTEGTQAMGIPGSEMERHMISQTPLGRMGQPEDIARVAVFLASDDAGWVTGEVISASGGTG